MRSYLACVCVCSAIALVGARTAAAAPVGVSITDYFTFSFDGVPGTGTTTISASPTPSSYVAGTSFTLSNVAISFMGTSYTTPVTFFNAGGAGSDGSNIGGDVLFNGIDATPTFLLGTFNLAGIVDLGDGSVPLTGTVDISQNPPVVPVLPTSATPEPASLALVGTSVLGFAGVLRRRFSGHPARA